MKSSRRLSVVAGAVHQLQACIECEQRVLATAVKGLSHRHYTTLNRSPFDRVDLRILIVNATRNRLGLSRATMCMCACSWPPARRKRAGYGHGIAIAVECQKSKGSLHLHFWCYAQRLHYVGKGFGECSQLEAFHGKLV